ncbi:MAG: hypothetical protein U5N55_12000 [Cypionkella sp.]|nr:hypothetical protein [Cypionkella sp.]
MSLFPPDDFANDWYGYATNQAGHALIIGSPSAMILAPWLGYVATPVIVALVYGIVWEWIVQGGRLWRDSVEDTAHVMTGASLICGALAYGYWVVVVCLVAWLCLLAFGVYRRVWR